MSLPSTGWRSMRALPAHLRGEATEWLGRLIAFMILRGRMP